MAHSYTYDAENKVSKVDAVWAYVYDGEGQRVRKLVGENLRFVYGISGQRRRGQEYQTLLSCSEASCLFTREVYIMKAEDY